MGNKRDDKRILQDLLNTTEQQVYSVTHGDYNRLLLLSQQHEMLLKEAAPVFQKYAGVLQSEQADPEMKVLIAKLEHAHSVLRELLQKEMLRVNTQIRILAGSGSVTYRKGNQSAEEAHLLNIKA